MKNKEEMKNALKAIQQLGYGYIRINYSGGGDSGDMDKPDYYESAEDAEHEKIKGITMQEHFDLLSKRREACSIHFEKLQPLIDKILNEIEDWWNNDGGYGNIIINTSTGSYEIDNNIYFTESTAYSHKGKLIEEDGTPE